MDKKSISHKIGRMIIEARHPLSEIWLTQEEYDLFEIETANVSVDRNQPHKSIKILIKDKDCAIQNS